MLPAWAVTPPRFSCDFGTRRIPGRLRLRRAVTAHARGCVQLAAHDSLRGVIGVAAWQLVALAAMSYGTHYKDIWTKDPHGGAYHRVSAAGFRPQLRQRLFVRSREGAAVGRYE